MERLRNDHGQHASEENYGRQDSRSMGEAVEHIQLSNPRSAHQKQPRVAHTGEILRRKCRHDFKNGMGR